MHQVTREISRERLHRYNITSLFDCVHPNQLFAQHLLLVLKGKGNGGIPISGNLKEGRKEPDLANISHKTHSMLIVRSIFLRRERGRSPKWSSANEILRGVAVYSAHVRQLLEERASEALKLITVDCFLPSFRPSPSSLVTRIAHVESLHLPPSHLAQRHKDRDISISQSPFCRQQPRFWPDRVSQPAGQSNNCIRENSISFGAIAMYNLRFLL